MAVDTARTEQVIEERGAAAYAAEFLGTFLLVLFIALAVILNSRGGLGFTDWAVIGLVHAFVLMILVHSLGGTSGAHFNPAVTATLTALRKIAPADAAIYVILQLAGAVLAALVAKALLKDEGSAAHYGAPGVSDFLSGRNFAGFTCELIGTFMLMWGIMAAAVNPRAPRGWAPWIIGSALGLAVMVFGPLTGAGLNPARSFGPALVAHHFGGLWTFVFVYVIGPLVGALIAGIAYTAIVLRPQALALGLEDVAVTAEGDLEIGRDTGLIHPGERPIDKLE